MLIRDAAYEALAKGERADLHERFADWLERRRRPRIATTRIVGYHLDQAHRYRVELGETDRSPDRSPTAPSPSSHRPDAAPAIAEMSRRLSRS